MLGRLSGRGSGFLLPRGPGQRVERRECRVDIAVQRLVVASEGVEAACEPRLGRAKRRKIMSVLDAVMAAEMRDERAQRRRRARGEPGGRQALRAKIGRAHV